PLTRPAFPAPSPLAASQISVAKAANPAAPTASSVTPIEPLQSGTASALLQRNELPPDRSETLPQQQSAKPVTPESRVATGSTPMVELAEPIAASANV